MNVLVVDDHQIVREGLCRILEGQHGLNVTAQAGTGAEAVSVCRRERIDVVIMDISLPDRNGLEVMKDIQATSPATKVLVLSVHPENQFAVRALRAGASGYLTKESASEELVEAVISVAGGSRYINGKVAQQLSDLVLNPDDAPLHERLSDREFEVLRLIASGKPAREIAEILNLSVKTVSTYRARMLEKLNMTTNAELTHYAFQHNLVE